MFTSSQLEQMPVELEKLFRELEVQTMSDIVRRIKINDEITRAADWQLHRLQELGKSSEYLRQLLIKTLKESEGKVDKLYSEIISQGYAYDEALYNAVGVKQTPFQDNAELQQLISAIKAQTNGEFKNITQSLGFAENINGKVTFKPIADFYQKTLDNALLDISSGLFDYNTVLKRTVETMTKSGLRTVDYATGWSNRIDVAARRAMMTGVNQVVAKINDQNAEKLDTNYFEVSWHGTARPTHQLWQGRVYTKEQLITVCGLGTVTGICGANCRHSYWAFIPGVSTRTYTDEELEEMNSKENVPIEYNGKEYTAYEATQRQRQLETLMRKQRQDIQLFKDGNASEDIIMASQARYRKTMSEYVEFSKAMELPQQMQRVYADGLKDIGGHGKLKIKPKTFTHTDKSDIINVNEKGGKSQRFATSQEHIDELVKSDLSGIKLTKQPIYNSRLRCNGKTTYTVSSSGRVIDVKKVEIGKQDKSSAEFLLDTILHEELEARVLSRNTTKFTDLSHASETVRHKYINKLIKRYFRVKEWNYDME